MKLAMIIGIVLTIIIMGFNYINPQNGFENRKLVNLETRILILESENERLRYIINNFIFNKQGIYENGICVNRNHQLTSGVVKCYNKIK